MKWILVSLAILSSTVLAQDQSLYILQGGSNGPIERWQFPNSTTRSGVSGLFAQDIGKIGFQTDTGAYYRLNDLTPTWLAIGGGGGGTGSPGGANTNVQWNNAGAFGGSAAFTYTDASGLLNLNLSQNAQTLFQVTNNNTGTGADAAVTVSNGTGFFSMGMQGVNEAAYGIIGSGDAYYYKNSSGKLAIMANGTGNYIKYATGGNTESFRMAGSGDSGEFTIGLNQDTGIARNAAGILEVNNGTAGTLASLKTAKIGNLTSNGFVKTGSGDGTLSVDTNMYLTANQAITLSGDVTGSGATAITTAYNNAVPVGKAGAPTGGTAGQVLYKINSTDYNYAWGTVGGGSVPIVGVNTIAVGNLSPLFTSSPSTATSGAVNVTYSLSTAGANTVFGNANGLAGAPVFSSSPRFTAIGNLTTNGFVTTSGGTGTLGIDTNTYLTGNQAITLSGKVTGSGTTAITTSIASGAVGATEINNAVNLAMTAAQSVIVQDAGTTNQLQLFQLGHNSTGTPAANFGGQLLLTAKSDTTLNRTAGDVRWYWSTATDATRTSTIQLRTVNSGSFINEITMNGSTGGVDINGTNTNDNAAAGNVGEQIQSLEASTAATTVSTGVTGNVLSLSLTAGDWDVSAVCSWTFTSVTAVSSPVATISTTSATIADDGTQVYGGMPWTGTSTSFITGLAIPKQRVSLAATTTVYLVGRITFTGTGKVFGSVFARRIR